MVIGVGMVGVGITGEALTPTTEDAELWSRIGLTGLVIMSLYESVFATKEVYGPRFFRGPISS
ncbi:MAG: hypothetical protein WCF75_26525, partial [Pseudolabrys sp.]